MLEVFEMTSTHVMGADRPARPLLRKRILVCGKGGSGKSTLVALLAMALEQRGDSVVVLDGDASNPEGWCVSCSVWGCGRSPSR